MVSRSEDTLTIKGWRGLDISAPANSIPNEMLSECFNWDITPYGALRKRKGWEFASWRAGSGATGGFGFVLGAYRHLGQEYVVSTAGPVTSKGESHPRFSLDNGVTWTNVGLSGANPPLSVISMVQYNDVAYFIQEVSVGGPTPIYSWNGVQGGQVAIAGSPSGSQGVIFKDRLFVVNASTTTPSRIYYSAVTDPTSWPASNFFDVGAGDGDRVTGIIPYQDRLMIFKGTSTWLLTTAADPTNWVQRKIDGKVGAQSPWGFSEVEGLVYFISQRGVYVTDGSVFRNISTEIPGGVFAKRGRRYETYYRDSLSQVDRQIICSINNTMYVYHLDSSGWTRYTLRDVDDQRIVLNKIFEGVDSNGESYFLSATNDAFNNCLILKQSDFFVDAFSKEIQSTLRTKRFDFDQPDTLKRGKLLVLDCLSDKEGALFSTETDLTVQYEYDEQYIASSTIPGYIGPTIGGIPANISRKGAVKNLLDVKGSKAIKIRGPGYFRQLQILISDTGNSPLELVSLNLVAHIKRTVVDLETS